MCRDVKVEPELLPIGETELQSTNVADKARLRRIGHRNMELNGKNFP